MRYMETKIANGWRIAAVIALTLCLILGIFFVTGLFSENSTETPQQTTTEEVLSSWSSDSAARDKLISYVNAVTPDGEGFRTEMRILPVNAGQQNSVHGRIG